MSGLPQAAFLLHCSFPMQWQRLMEQECCFIPLLLGSALANMEQVEVAHLLVPVSLVLGSVHVGAEGSNCSAVFVWHGCSCHGL